MSKNLFEIRQSMMDLLEYGVDEDGCLIETEEEFKELYDKIQLDIETKVDNTVCLGKIIDGEIEVIDKEIKRLQGEKKAREKKKEWLSNRIDTFIRLQFINEQGELDEQGLNKYKWTLPHSKISYRKSDKVEILDIDKIPKEYINTKTEVSANKSEIKKAIKNGKQIDGATIQTNINLVLK